MWLGGGGMALMGGQETPRRANQAGCEKTGLTGLEPATSAVTVRHSNQLSYSPS